MDPLTQVALGSAIGTVTLGRKVGARKAAIVGGIVAELPDIDVFFPTETVIDAFVDHRGPTHSILIQLLATPLFGEILRRIDPRLRNEWLLCYGVSFALLATHPLLDAFNAYGTKLLWPLFTDPISWSSIFVIDPLYTLPLLVAMFVSLFARKPAGPSPLSDRARRAASWGLILSTAYMGWTLAARELAESRILAALDAREAGYRRLEVIPMPFNSLLWRGLAVDDDSYINVYVSLLDPDEPAPLHEHPRNLELAALLPDRHPVDRIEWFSRGFYGMRRSGDEILVSDLRIGVEPDYVFTYRVGAFNSETPVNTVPERRAGHRDWSQLGWMWRRIFDPRAAREE